MLATKFGSPVDGGPGGAAPDYVRAAAERSLKRLGTDRIDLYQLHRPDPTTPIADTLGALDELIDAGKVREIGCSNFSAAQLREADAAASASGGHHFVSVQNHYNLLNRGDEEEVLPECRRLGIAYLPYFPLASGLLTGKYTAGQAPPAGTRLHRWGERANGMLTDRNFEAVEAAGRWAAGHGRSMLDLADRLAPRRARHRLGHRRSDPCGPGASQCRRRDLAALRRPARRGRIHRRCRLSRPASKVNSESSAASAAAGTPRGSLGRRAFVV